MTSFAKVDKLFLPERFGERQPSPKPMEDRLAADVRALEAWAEKLLTVGHTHDGADLSLPTADALAAIVATGETTTTTTFTDLTTSGPAVTLTPGSSGKVLVAVYGQLANNTASARSLMSFAVSSGNTVAAADNSAIMTFAPTTAGIDGRLGASFLLTGLAASSSIFTAKYRVTAGTGTFTDRRIVVIPL